MIIQPERQNVLIVESQIKLGMEWEKEEDETRKETLLTKAKVLHSMPLYVANKIMNIILLLAVVLLVVLFLVFSF